MFAQDLNGNVAKAPLASRISIGSPRAPRWKGRSRAASGLPPAFLSSQVRRRPAARDHGLVRVHRIAVQQFSWHDGRWQSAEATSAEFAAAAR